MPDPLRGERIRAVLVPLREENEFRLDPDERAPAENPRDPSHQIRHAI